MSRVMEASRECGADVAQIKEPMRKSLLRYWAGAGALLVIMTSASQAIVLNAICEEDFLGFSYGFRPGRGPNNAFIPGNMQIPQIFGAGLIYGTSHQRARCD